MNNLKLFEKDYYESISYPYKKEINKNIDNMLN